MCMRSFLSTKWIRASITRPYISEGGIIEDVKLRMESLGIGMVTLLQKYTDVFVEDVSEIKAD